MALAQKEEKGYDLVNYKLFIPERGRDNWLIKSFNDFISREELLNLSGFILGKGPGSFTGLRISYAFFKSLSMMTEIPLYEINTLLLWEYLGVSDNARLFYQFNKNLFYYRENNKTLPLSIEQISNFFSDKDNRETRVWLAQENDNSRIEYWKTIWPDDAFLFLTPSAILSHISPLEGDLIESGWKSALPEYGDNLSAIFT